MLKILLVLFLSGLLDRPLRDKERSPRSIHLSLGKWVPDLFFLQQLQPFWLLPYFPTFSNEKVYALKLKSSFCLSLSAPFRELGSLSDPVFFFYASAIALSYLNYTKFYIKCQMLKVGRCRFKIDMSQQIEK